MSIFVIILLALSLSMDAFSLAFAYGTVYLPSKIECLVSISVGVAHFFMPIFGSLFGEIFVKFFDFSVNIIACFIFIGLGIEMIFSMNNEEKLKELRSCFSIFLFAFSVSIDSFLVGINLTISNVNMFLVSFIFLIVSSVCTYLGLKLGKKVNIALGNYSTIIGGIILIILGLFYLK